jgi:RimJ/RimL family protein N-acetyltransferase
MELRKMPAAQIRYDRTDMDLAQISFSVARAMRGRGLGTSLVRLTLPLAARELELKKVTAMVLAANKASQRVFTKTGFSIKDQQIINGRECLVYQRFVR